MNSIRTTPYAFLVLVLSACAPSVPELPPLEIQRFSQAIRGQVAKAYEDAQEHRRDAGASGRLGMVLHAYSLFENAEAAYHRAQLLDPSEYAWPYYLGIVQMAQSRTSDAATSFRTALALRPDDINAQLRLADALSTAGNFAESSQWYRKVIDAAPRRADAYSGLGRTLDALGDTERAVNMLQQAVSLAPAYAGAHYALASALRKLGRDDEARTHLAAYQTSPKSNPASDDPLLQQVAELDRHPDTLLRRGTALEQQGRSKEALQIHLDIIRFDPRNEPAHANLVTIYTKLGQFAQAEQHYQIAVALEPTHSRLLNAFAALRIQQDRLQEATEVLNRCIEIDPRYPECQHSLAYLSERNGRKQEALDRYLSIVRVNPSYKAARFHAGRVLLELKRDREAEQLFLQLVEPAEDQKNALEAIAGEYAKLNRSDVTRRFAASAAHRAALFPGSSLERDLTTYFPVSEPRR